MVIIKLHTFYGLMTIKFERHFTGIVSTTPTHKRSLGIDHNETIHFFMENLFFLSFFSIDTEPIERIQHFPALSVSSI